MSAKTTNKTPNKTTKKSSDISRLHLSAAHGPAECQQAAALTLQRLTEQASRANLRIDIEQKTTSAVGILSASLTLRGAGASDFAGQWCGTIQWICQSSLRPNHRRKNWFIGIFPLGTESKTSVASAPPTVQTCKASGKGGQHVNKTRSAVQIFDAENNIRLKVQQERCQHHNKRLAWQLWQEKKREKQQENQRQSQTQRHQLNWQVTRGNPVKTFVGKRFQEIKSK